MTATSAKPGLVATTVERENSEQGFRSLRQAILLVSLPFGILNFVLPVFGKRMGASAVEIGMMFSTFSLMIVLLRPLVGAGLDRYGRRWFFLAGMLAYSGSMAAFGFSTGVLGLVIARTLEGVASALLWLSANAMVADLSQADQRGSSFGNISQAANQGGIAGTFIGFAVLLELGVEAGWKPLFLGFAGVALLAALYAWRKLPETSPHQTRAIRVPQSSLAPLLRSRTMLLLLLGTLVTAISWSMVSPIMMIFLQERFQANFTELAWAYFPSAMVWAILPTRMGKLADRFGRKPLMVISMTAAAISSFIIPGLTSLVALAILLTIQALCYAAGDPAEQALVTDITREDQRGRAFGLLALAGGLGSVIGPLAGGWVYDTIGQTTPFLVNGVVLAICTLLMVLLLNERKKPIY